MNDRRSEDRPYAATVVAFLIGLVLLGLLGVPALLVAAIGAASAAVAITVFHGVLERRVGSGSGASRRRRQVARQYVPRVLETGSTRRRRIAHLRRHRHPSPPLRFR